mgnify:CR=1 FL=1
MGVPFTERSPGPKDKAEKLRVQTSEQGQRVAVPMVPYLTESTDLLKDSASCAGFSRMIMPTRPCESSQRAP